MMKFILTWLAPLLKVNIHHPLKVLLGAFLLSCVGGYFALQLKVDTDLANLLPKNHPNVQALNELKNMVGGETAMQVVIKSPDFEDNKRFAEVLIPRSLALIYPRYNEGFFERVEYTKDTEFIQDNALYLASDRELADLTEWLEDEIQQAKEEANPFYFDLGFEDDAEEEETDIDDFRASYESIIPSEYPVNEDSTIMVLNFYPTGSKSDIQFLEDMFAAYDSLVIDMQPTSYNAQMQVYYGGRLQRHLEELTSIMSDVLGSFVSGIGSVILLVMLYFFLKKYLHYRKGVDDSHSFMDHVVRMPLPIFIIGVPLISSLLWTFGLTYFVLGMLNTMTSVLFVILFGLGIDYGIHYYARYIELRSDGLGVQQAIYATHETTGEAIVVSALTTAAALFVLIIADFRGFSEFGFISGVGIIFALLAMLYLLPSILILLERYNLILFSKRKATKVHSTRVFPFYKSIVLMGVVIAGLVLFNAGNLRFQYDFGKLEPRFPEYEQFSKLSGQVSTGTKRNPAYIIADDDKQVQQLLEVLREQANLDTASPTIASIEALQERFPTTEVDKKHKLEKIKYIQELLADPLLANEDSEDFKRLRRASQTTSALTIEQVPEYLQAQFVSKDGEIGRFVIVYPSVGLSDGKKSIAFKDDVSEIVLPNGTTKYAASTSIVAASMLDLMRSESPYMVGATFVIVFLFMLFTFRSIKWSIIAMLPLMIGLLFLFGIMLFTGFQFNFYNLVVLPAILGIGEDSGVHLAYRYREEGKERLAVVLASTGQHITMGSFTTMLGFAGLLFTSHPGLQSLGIMAILGIGTTLVTSLTFLPALLQWLELKGKI